MLRVGPGRSGILARAAVAAVVIALAGCGGPRAEAERDLRLFYQARARGDWEGARGLMTPEGRAISDPLALRGYRIAAFEVRELRVSKDGGSARVKLVLEGDGAAIADERVELVHRAGRWRVARLRREPLKAAASFDVGVAGIGLDPPGCAGPVRVHVQLLAVGAVVDPPDLTANLLRREGGSWRVYRVAIVPRALPAAGSHRVVVFEGLDLPPGEYRLTARLPVLEGESDASNNRAEHRFRCASGPPSSRGRP
ncbi:MAG: hypothetical protein QN163_02050 [Armatimonadota bacterium]|nr:hypothetical protein [Armatimonadota bacterium]MDR5696292.1 hypothetical protein [Armatimonadota bacterium]